MGRFGGCLAARLYGAKGAPGVSDQRDTPARVDVANATWQVVARRGKRPKSGWVHWRELLPMGGKSGEFHPGLRLRGFGGACHRGRFRRLPDPPGKGVKGGDVGVEIFAPQSPGATIAGPQAPRRLTRRQRVITQKLKSDRVGSP